MAADKRRFLDVWIVDTNTVYQEVPYEVVTDWLQQGRLLDDDKTKPSGTRDWIRIGDSSDLRPFSLSARDELPQDEAEALEPVELDYVGPTRRRHEEEDDDIDMIPLIDVSLVLLIFFMLTATTAGAAQRILTPNSEFGQTVDDPNGVRIDIVLDESTGRPLFSVAEGNKPAAEDDKDLDSLRAVLSRLRPILDRRDTPANLTINAQKNVPAIYSRDLLMSLRDGPNANKLLHNFLGVREGEP